MASGQWYPITECIRDCGDPTIPSGTMIEHQNGTTVGSVIKYACKPELTLVNGTLVRTCGMDGSWNGIEPICATATCTGDKICYMKFLNKDLPGHDIDNLSFVKPTFEECSKTCEAETAEYKSIEYCQDVTKCSCKNVNDLDGYELTNISSNCSYYRKL
ncbi:CUB and sushi domain-containing protein 3 [Mactra antiquata]